MLVFFAATLVFLVLDYAAGLNVRLAFLESSPTARAAYYGICFLCLTLMLWQPAWTVLIGAFESLVTMVALIFAVAMKTLLVSDAMIEAGTGYVTMEQIVNFLISGSVADFAWIRGMDEIRRQICR